MADTTKFQTLSPLQLSIAVGFLMSRLPEGDLAELDAMLDGDEAQVAQDAAYKNPKALSWVRMTSHTRHAVRQSRAIERRQSAANHAEFLKKFPDAGRIG